MVHVIKHRQIALINLLLHLICQLVHFKEVEVDDEPSGYNGTENRHVSLVVEQLALKFGLGLCLELAATHCISSSSPGRGEQHK